MRLSERLHSSFGVASRLPPSLFRLWEAKVFGLARPALFSGQFLSLGLLRSEYIGGGGSYDEECERIHCR